MVLTNGKIINSKESEIPMVQQLIAALDLTGVIFTLDVLHCQKNSWGDGRKWKSLCDRGEESQLKLYKHIKQLTEQKNVGWFSETEVNKGKA
ncbi:MAG: hypothetical protein AAF600_21610 [Bacteroidota bacterium]